MREPRGIRKGESVERRGREGEEWEGRKRNVGYTIHTLSKGDPLGKAPVSGVAMRDIVDFAATRGRCRVTTKVQIRLHWILLMKDGSNVYQKLVVF